MTMRSLNTDAGAYEYANECDCCGRGTDNKDLCHDCKLGGCNDCR